MIKNIIKKYIPTFLLNNIQTFNRRRIRNKIMEEWEKKGCQLPSPHALKQIVIEEYKKKYGAKILVETGTYYGDMVEAQRMHFDKIITIELSEKLWEKAVGRFKHYEHITVLKGDSGTILQTIVKDLNEKTIFWLDGHYSQGITAKGVKECPILEEVDAILKNNNPKHILLIDDARCFIGQGDYPTIEELAKYIQNYNSGYNVIVKDDIIRCTIELMKKITSYS